MKSSMTCDEKINLISTTINEIIEDMRAQKSAICKVFEKSDICRSFDSIESCLDSQCLKNTKNRAIVDNAFILILLVIDTILVVSFMQITSLTHFHLASLFKSYIC